MKLYVSRVACTATLALFAVSVFAQSSAIRSKGQTLRGCRRMTSNSARKLPICVKGDKK